MGSYWGPKGVLGGLLGPFFASLAPSGDLWAPPWGSPRPSWLNFSQFRSPKTPPSSIFHRFSILFNEKHKIFNMKITDFHTDLPTTYHSYFLYFQSFQSFFPSNPPVIQSSKHPMWGRRNARSVWIKRKKGKRTKQKRKSRRKKQKK